MQMHGKMYTTVVQRWLKYNLLQALSISKIVASLESACFIQIFRKEFIFEFLLKIYVSSYRMYYHFLQEIYPEILEVSGQ